MSKIPTRVNWELKAKQHWPCKSKIESSLSSMNYSFIIFTQLSIYSIILALLIQRSHFLISLLCLEGIMLRTVLFIPLLIYSVSLMLPTIRIIILTFGACEASLGLSLLVKISRSYGSDMISSISINKC